MRIISNIFGEVPFKKLDDHNRIVSESVRKLDSALHEINNDAYKDLREIGELESEADELKHEIRDKLPSNYIMPVSRGDLIRLLKEQDEIIDECEEAAGWLIIREKIMKPERELFPEEIYKDILKLSERNREAIKNLRIASKKIKNGLESNLTSEMISEIHGIVRRINEIKDETDDIKLDLISDIFDHKEKLTPNEILYLIKLAEFLNSIADHADSTADRMRLLLAKS